MAKKAMASLYAKDYLYHIRIASIHIIMHSLVPRPHLQKEERVWYTSSDLLGAQDAARLVTVMTTHRFGIAMHQPLS